MRRDQRIENLQKARVEAERFIQRCKDAEKHLATPENDWSGKQIVPTSYPSYSKPFAAAKRSSLDLTNALADLRRRESA